MQFTRNYFGSTPNVPTPPAADLSSFFKTDKKDSVIDSLQQRTTDAANGLIELAKTENKQDTTKLEQLKLPIVLSIKQMREELETIKTELEKNEGDYQIEDLPMLKGYFEKINVIYANIEKINERILEIFHNYMYIPVVFIQIGEVKYNLPVLYQPATNIRSTLSKTIQKLELGKKTIELQENLQEEMFIQSTSLLEEESNQDFQNWISQSIITERDPAHVRQVDKILEAEEVQEEDEPSYDYDLILDSLLYGLSEYNSDVVLDKKDRIIESIEVIINWQEQLKNGLNEIADLPHQDMQQKILQLKDLVNKHFASEEHLDIRTLCADMSTLSKDVAQIVQSRALLNSQEEPETDESFLKNCINGTCNTYVHYLLEDDHTIILAQKQNIVNGIKSINILQNNLEHHIQDPDVWVLLENLPLYGEMRQNLTRLANLIDRHFAAPKHQDLRDMAKEMLDVNLHLIRVFEKKMVAR